MADVLRKSAQKVADVLAEKGFGCEVVEFSESTRTAQEAADAVGCTVPQIVKSLVLRGRNSGDPVLVEAGGANRVDMRKIAALTGEKMTMADADFVREVTGYAIGGIPPLGHDRQMRTFIDQDLLAFEEIWAAAGTPFAVFKLTPGDLVAMTGGEVAAVAKD